MVKTTALDVDILTADRDRHNIAFIDNARDAGRIDDETAQYLRRLYSDGMDCYRDVFHVLGKCFGAPKTAVTEYDPAIIEKLAKANLLYFAGRNNGVAEELTLKTNEITRKKSDYLEGTYLLHGVEEVMSAGDACILIDPFPSEYGKIKEFIEGRAGLTVIAVANEDTPFPTIKLPKLTGYDPFLQLMAGWNLLVQIGIALGIDLDKPERARKVGNQFEG